MIDACAAQGVNPGYALGRDYEDLADGLLVAITEQRSKADIDTLARVLKGAVREVQAEPVARLKQSEPAEDEAEPVTERSARGPEV